MPKIGTIHSQNTKPGNFPPMIVETPSHANRYNTNNPLVPKKKGTNQLKPGTIGLEDVGAAGAASGTASGATSGTGSELLIMY